MYVFIINVFLVLWALHQFSQTKSSALYRVQCLEKKGVELKDYLWSSIFVGFISISWRSEFVNQSRLWRAQIWDFRRFLFSSSQSLFSFFWILLCFALFLELGGYVLLGMAFFVFVAGCIKKIRQNSLFQTLRSGIYLALTLFFLELAFKNSGLLMQYLMETEIVFWFTLDSSFYLLTILFAGTLVGFFLPIQGWALVVSFFLYLNSQASFLAFIYIVLGELIGTTVYLIFKIRGWDRFYRDKMKSLMFWILGYLVFFAMAAYVWRYFFSLGGSYNQLSILKWIYLGTVFLLLAGLYVTVMIWGHFTALKQDRDVVISDAGLVGELVDAATDPLSVFIVTQLGQRYQKLLGYQNDLETDSDSRKKIPPFVLNQFEAEIKIIEKLIRPSLKS